MNDIKDYRRSEMEEGKRIWGILICATAYQPINVSLGRYSALVSDDDHLKPHDNSACCRR